jgi:SAM-dependent methyltransferase
VVELGVGTGRIAIEAARRGKAVTGVDSSTAMLALCRERAATAGVADLLTLVQADFREFTLPEPAELVALPFHTIGHLVSPNDKRAALRHVYGQLAPGGRLILDHFVFDAELARTYHGPPRLRAEYRDGRTGRDVLLWVGTVYDFADQTMRIVAWTDELDDEGVVLRRRYRRLRFSWVEPGQMRALLVESGFEVAALYGDFDRRPFDDRSTEQVWVARRPG